MVGGVGAGTEGREGNQADGLHVAHLVKSRQVFTSVAPSTPPPTPPLPLPPPLQEAHEGAAASAGGTGTAGSGGWAGSHSGRIFGVSWHLGERFQLVRDPRVHFDGFAGE